MDTKGKEVLYLDACFREFGIPVLTMDAGIIGESPFPVSITRDEVSREAGMTLTDVQNIGDEGKALALMVKGAVRCTQNLFRGSRIQGIIGLGGSMGSTLGTGVMRSLPVGFPKVMISTMASSNTRPFIGSKDILMLYSVCDISGINRILGKVLRNGALALVGMIKGLKDFPPPTTPLIALSTLGTTEACSRRVSKAFEDKGYEVIVFHAQGSGGAAMEEMVQEEEVEGVIDLSVSEIGDHQFGGDYDAGPDRGRAALQKGIPTVLVPGNIDFLGGGPLKIAQQRFPGRILHVHNAAITAVRTTKQEMEVVAKILAKYCNQAKGPVSCIVPRGGFSAFDHKGGPFYDPDASKFYAATFKSRLLPSVPLQILPYHINDPEFSEAVIEAMNGLLRNKGNRKTVARA